MPEQLYSTTVLFEIGWKAFVATWPSTSIPIIAYNPDVGNSTTTLGAAPNFGSRAHPYAPAAAWGCRPYHKFGTRPRPYRA